MACAGGPKNGIVNVMEVILRSLMALCWNKQCEKLNNAVLSASEVLESFCIPAMTRIHANRLFPELPSAHCALAEKSKKVRAIPRCPMPWPPLPPYLVPSRVTLTYPLCELYSEKYHLKKIPLEVAKGTISPNLATVRLYHSNKHSAREGAKKREETQLLFITSKNCYKDKEFLNAAKLATSRSCRSWQIIICDLADEKYTKYIFNIIIYEKFLLVHVKYRDLIQFRRSTSGYEFSYRVNLHVQENTLEQLNILQVRKRTSEDYKSF
ncbi:hypothetical protein ALC53_04692 [Atta colombica]|uniref:Uncharacterized protein n=1 Tax=Atta colombica TaxID=520822 RepID=A0A195BL02_9HYME|nr:hypothetical protein ALC53_04692 [Atta colombica]